MKGKIPILLPFTIGIFFSLTAWGHTADSQYTSNFEKTVSAEGFHKVSIDARIGGIKIYGWEREELRLEGVKKIQNFLGRSRFEGNIDNITVTLKKENGEFSIRVRGPTTRRMFFDAAGYGVELNLWLPRGMEIDINQNIGEVRVEEMTSSVQVRNNIGEIYVETDLTDEGVVSLRTNIGGIELELPEDTSARISAEVNIGSVDVSSSFRGISSTGGFIGRDYHATIGEGRSRVDLSVNIGSIDVLAK